MFRPSFFSIDNRKTSRPARFRMVPTLKSLSLQQYAHNSAISFLAGVNQLAWRVYGEKSSETANPEIIWNQSESANQNNDWGLFVDHPKYVATPESFFPNSPIPEIPLEYCRPYSRIRQSPTRLRFKLFEPRCKASVCLLLFCHSLSSPTLGYKQLKRSNVGCWFCPMLVVGFAFLTFAD